VVLKAAASTFTLPPIVPVSFTSSRRTTGRSVRASGAKVCSETSSCRPSQPRQSKRHLKAWLSGGAVCGEPATGGGRGQALARISPGAHWPARRRTQQRMQSRESSRCPAVGVSRRGNGDAGSDFSFHRGRGDWRPALGAFQDGCGRRAFLSSEWRATTREQCGELDADHPPWRARIVRANDVVARFNGRAPRT